MAIATEYVLLDTGEIGFISQDYNSIIRRGDLSDKTFIRYRSLETSRRRSAYIDNNSFKRITVDEYVKILRGEKYTSSFKANSRRKNTERDQYIYEQRKSGRTYKSIADEFNITGQRVKAICDMEERRRRNA